MNIFALLTLLSNPADASVTFGNPTVTLALQGGTLAYVDSMVLYPCSGGSEQLVVDQDVTDSATGQVYVPSDLYCGMDITVQWEGTGPFKTIAVGNTDQLKTVTGALTLNLVLNGAQQVAGVR